MKQALHVLVISLVAFFIASCTSVGVGVSGGSNSGVNVGAGVNIHLYTEQNK